jgi:hypothetical protein
MYLLFELCARYDRYCSMKTSDLSVGTHENNGNVVCNKDNLKKRKMSKTTGVK